MAEGSRERKDLASTRMLCLLLFAVQFRTIGKGVGIETGMVRGVRKGNRRKLVRLLIFSYMLGNYSIYRNKGSTSAERCHIEEE